MGNGLGITGFVFSLIGLVLFFIPFLGLILGIVGLILCIIQMKREKTGLAIAGLIIGIIAIIVGILYFIAIIFVWVVVQDTLTKGINNLSEFNNNFNFTQNYCSEVEFNAVKNPDGGILISNSGNIPIYSIILKIKYLNGSSDTIDKMISINPKDTQTLPVSELPSDYSNLKIIPVLFERNDKGLVEPTPCSDVFAIIEK